MSSDEPKRKLVGPWQTIHGVIWVIGIYIMWTRNLWWPGILILVVISALYEAFVRRYIPGGSVEENPATPAVPEQVSPPVQVTPPAVVASTTPRQEHRVDLLPQVCPSCNAPIRGHEVKWTGAQSANCAYCGTNLPMNKA